MDTIKIMIEYLLKNFYYENLKIVNNIVWLRKDEPFDNELKCKHVIDPKWYAYRIGDVIYTEDSEQFRIAIDKAEMWDKLKL